MSFNEITVKYLTVRTTKAPRWLLFEMFSQLTIKKIKKHVDVVKVDVGSKSL